jgi:hypothetical protein
MGAVSARRTQISGMVSERNNHHTTPTRRSELDRDIIEAERLLSVEYDKLLALADELESLP